MKLFVLNQTEEYICDVAVEPAVMNGSKLLVVSYCRDPDITGPKYELKCTLKPKSPEDERKYSSFMGYIMERKKTAVLKLDASETLLYAHYPDENAASKVITLYRRAAPALAGPAPLAIVAPPGHASAAPVEGAKATPPQVKATGGFLSNLLGKIENKGSFGTHSTADSSSKVDQVAALELETRKLLRSFLDSSGENELAMEPMDKNSRYIVHEIVDEFENLVSASVGDDDERHVVVYRKGFEPPDVQLHLGTDFVRNMKRKAVSNKSMKANLDAPVSAFNISKIESEKRDRRSIEEIQKDMKRRKLDHEEG